MKKTTLSLLFIAFLFVAVVLTICACTPNSPSGPSNTPSNTTTKNRLEVKVDDNALIFSDAELDDVKQSLTVSLLNENGAKQPLTEFTLEGKLTVGQTELTVRSGELSASFTIKVIDSARRRYVNFDSNGGSEVATIVTTYGATISEPERPTRDNYKFVGWYNYSQWDFAKNTVTQNDLTLIARWEWIFAPNETKELTYRQEGDYYCVSGCESNAQHIVIPSTYCDLPVKAIDTKAFNGCKHIETVAIPDTVEKLGKYAFQNCTKLYAIEWGQGLKEIGDRAFYGCVKLYSIHIPEGVTRIGEKPFYSCEQLTSIYLPASLTSISDDIFYECERLQTITVAEGNAKYHSEGNCLIETYTQTMVAGCAYSVVPSDGSVTKLASGLFRDCKVLTTFTIPASVREIGDEAFSNCQYLNTLYIGCDVTSIGSRILDMCYRIKTVKYDGTMEQWNNIYKKSPWKGSCSPLDVECNDGMID